MLSSIRVIEKMKTKKTIKNLEFSKHFFLRGKKALEMQYIIILLIMCVVAVLVIWWYMSLGDSMNNMINRIFK